MLLAVTLAFGVQRWERAYGGQYDDFGWDVGQTSDGGYVVLEQTQYVGYGLFKVDSLGEVEWWRSYPDTWPYTRVFVRVAPTLDGVAFLLATKIATRR